LGYGSAGGTELLRLAIWDSIASPTDLNASASSTGISSGTANLQTSFVTYTVGVAATSLKIGFWAGGNATGESVYVESGQLLLGISTPTSSGLH
jgi:hypothetical protein